VYGVAFAFAVANAYGLLFQINEGARVAVHLGPIAIQQVRVALSPLGVTLAALSLVGTIAALGLFARAVARGRRDGIVPLIGGVCMMGTAIYDAATAVLGSDAGTWLSPFGNSAFLFSITGAFLIRSSAQQELIDQSPSQATFASFVVVRGAPRGAARADAQGTACRGRRARRRHRARGTKPPRSSPTPSPA
jgi:hypothetical protein